MVVLAHEELRVVSGVARRLRRVVRDLQSGRRLRAEHRPAGVRQQQVCRLRPFRVGVVVHQHGERLLRLARGEVERARRAGVVATLKGYARRLLAGDGD